MDSAEPVKLVPLQAAANNLSRPLRLTTIATAGICSNFYVFKCAPTRCTICIIISLAFTAHFVLRQRWKRVFLTMFGASKKSQRYFQSQSTAHVDRTERKNKETTWHRDWTR